MTEYSVINSVLADNQLKQERQNSRQGWSFPQQPGSVHTVFSGERNLLNFNISGRTFTVSHNLLRKHQHSKLASLHKLMPYWSEHQNGFYFDRDPILFNAVMNVFKYDFIQIPKDYSEELLRKELDFWDIDLDTASIELSSDEKCLEKDFIWIEGKIPPPPDSASRLTKARHQVWYFLTDPLGDGTSYPYLAVAYAVVSILITMVFLVLCALSLKPIYRTVPSVLLEANHTAEVVEYNSRHCTTRIACIADTDVVDWLKSAIESVIPFLLFDTLFRLAACPCYKLYFKSVVYWLDLVATICLIIAVPFHIPALEPEDSSEAWNLAMFILEASQVLRVFKILQYANLLDGLKVMMLTLRASINELIILMLYILMAMFFFSTLITFVELFNDPQKGIPDVLIGYWWAVVTMTTVGYGDYYPESTAGYVVAFFCAITGVIFTALPVAVIGSNFNVYWEYNKKRKSRQAHAKASQERNVIKEYQVDRIVVHK